MRSQTTTSIINNNRGKMQLLIKSWSSKFSPRVSQMLCRTQHAATTVGTSWTFMSLRLSRQRQRPFSLPYACSTTIY